MTKIRKDIEKKKENVSSIYSDSNKIVTTFFNYLFQV
jgi:hypothetical protein